MYFLTLLLTAHRLPCSYRGPQGYFHTLLDSSVLVPTPKAIRPSMNTYPLCDCTLEIGPALLLSVTEIVPPVLCVNISPVW